MHCELPLVVPKSFSHRDSSRKLKMEDLRPSDKCLRNFDRIQAKNSKMTLPYHLKLI